MRRHDQLLAACGIHNQARWDDYVAQVRAARTTAGQPLTRWSPSHLRTALDLAVRGRGWPADHAATALLQVAADPDTRSPARLAEAGPWWDAPPDDQPCPTADLSALQAELDKVGGLRVQLQRTARQQLAAERLPVTRGTVITRAIELLHNLTAP